MMYAAALLRRVAGDSSIDLIECPKAESQAAAQKAGIIAANRRIGNRPDGTDRTAAVLPDGKVKSTAAGVANVGTNCRITDSQITLRKDAAAAGALQISRATMTRDEAAL